MKKFVKACLTAFVYVVLLSVSVVLATLVLHESGHYLTGIAAGCKNIRLVLIDSELGTYTQMNCPLEQSVYFPLVGALLLTLPYSLLFLLLGNLPERNLSFISLGFNLLISLTDLPLVVLQPIFLIAGVLLLLTGEALLSDKLLSFIWKV